MGAFEHEFAAYCGPALFGRRNGLDALSLILRGYGIGPGDEVIVPSTPVCRLGLAVSLAAATPVPPNRPGDLKPRSRIRGGCNNDAYPVGDRGTLYGLPLTWIHSTRLPGAAA